MNTLPDDLSLSHCEPDLFEAWKKQAEVDAIRVAVAKSMSVDDVIEMLKLWKRDFCGGIERINYLYDRMIAEFGGILDVQMNSDARK